MPDVTVEIQVWCGGCGAGGVTVEPCEACLEVAKEESYDDVYQEGQESAT